MFSNGPIFESGFLITAPINIQSNSGVVKSMSDEPIPKINTVFYLTYLLRVFRIFDF